MSLRINKRKGKKKKSILAPFTTQA